MYQYIQNVEVLKLQDNKEIELKNGFAILLTMYGKSPKKELVSFENAQGSKRYDVDIVKSVKFINEDFISLVEFQSRIEEYEAIDITDDWDNNRCG